MRTPRRRVRLARYKKNRRKVHQRFRQRIFERDRTAELAAHPQPKVVILTGAGISAESGIRTFRAADGLWEDHRVEDVATPEGFARDPQRVQAFYNARRQQLQQPDIQPNAAHLALAELESVLGDNFLLVTQNIDNLHERAGSQRVLHMHGELLKAFCLHCRTVVEVQGDLSVHDHCLTCGRKGGMRPDVVWFGEMPYQMERIQRALEECDLFVSVGTSGHVYPAAGFVAEARSSGAYTVELNLEPSEGASYFHSSIHGPATQVVPAFVQDLLTLV